MKFLVKDNPFSYDELYQAIQAYMRENYGKRPEYVLVHPETKRNMILSIQDEKESYMRYTFITQNFTQKDDAIRSNESIVGLYFLESENIEPGFLIVCG
jgi:hypothetical protein